MAFEVGQTLATVLTAGLRRFKSHGIIEKPGVFNAAKGAARYRSG